MKEYCKKMRMSKDIMSKLKKLKLKKMFSGKVISTYYDFSNKRLTKQNLLLRLRKKGKDTELTVKKKKKLNRGDILSIEVKEEKIRLDNYNSTKNLFKLLGLKKIREERFYREEYSGLGVKIETKNKKELEIESNSISKIKKIAGRLK